MPNSGNVYIVAGHGNIAVMDDQYGMPLSPLDLYFMIMSDPAYDGTQVRLLSCDVGKGDDNFAQHLADLLQAPVIAPDSWSWIYTS